MCNKLVYIEYISLLVYKEYIYSVYFFEKAISESQYLTHVCFYLE